MKTIAIALLVGTAIVLLSIDSKADEAYWLVGYDREIELKALLVGDVSVDRQRAIRNCLVICSDLAIVNTPAFDFEAVAQKCDRCTKDL